jgi:hypothetical protein
MKARVLFCLLAMAAGLAGCNHPYARFTSTQDPKYPVGRDSKIALSDNFDAQTVDIATRLASENLEQQMRALGFHLTTVAEADYLLSFASANKDVSQSYTVSVPTISNMVGTAGDRPVSGTVFGNEVVPQTRMVTMTQLQLWLVRTHDPKVEVWRGLISAEAADAQKYPTPFFRELLTAIGSTGYGAVQLDEEQKSAK